MIAEEMDTVVVRFIDQQKDLYSQPERPDLCRRTMLTQTHAAQC